MSRNHERKMENFYQPGDFDIDDEDFRILRNRIEGLLDKQSKRKRKRKRKRRQGKCNFKKARCSEESGKKKKEMEGKTNIFC